MCDVIDLYSDLHVIKSTHAVTSIKQSHVLNGNISGPVIYNFLWGLHNSFVKYCVHVTTTLLPQLPSWKVDLPDYIYIYSKGVDVVEWSRALDVRLSEWCCSVSMGWVQIPSREEQKFDSSKI